METKTVIDVDIPEFLINRQGYQTPVSEIEESVVIKDQIVKEKFAQMLNLREILKAFKAETFADLQAFMQLSAEKYEVEYGGVKGNVNLTTYDGKTKIQVSKQDNISYDENIHSAKTLVDEWFTEGYAEIESELIEKGDADQSALKTLRQQKLLIDSFFQVGKQGKISHSNMIKLRGLAIDHPKWKRAMQAITDSQQIDATTTHLRFYQRDEKGAEIHFSLDFASL